ncbi:MAG: hypothetical protein RL325_282 [Planctomycetota bacterium]
METKDWIRLLESKGLPPGALDEAGELPPDPTLFDGDRGEQRLWRACRGEANDLRPIVAGRTGSILAPDAYLAIEVWAECELAALHALHRLSRQPGQDREALRGRLRAAAHWHLEHTQPDNSTNRPWAIHVFLLLGDDRGEGGLYAETLLHNMAATDARTERISQWILADAARELRLASR